MANKVLVFSRFPKAMLTRFGERYAEFRVQYASTDTSEPYDGLYKAAVQRWSAGTMRATKARPMTWC